MISAHRPDAGTVKPNVSVQIPIAMTEPNSCPPLVDIAAGREKRDSENISRQPHQQLTLGTATLNNTIEPRPVSKSPPHHISPSPSPGDLLEDDKCARDPGRNFVASMFDCISIHNLHD
jgi:hypothetical protein